MISGRHTTKHLYKTMTKFLKEDCWDGGKPKEYNPEAKSQKE